MILTNLTFVGLCIKLLVDGKKVRAIKSRQKFEWLLYNLKQLKKIRHCELISRTLSLLETR